MSYNKLNFLGKAMKLNERLLVKFATDYSTADRDGFLLKKGEVNKGFQKRYFVLRGNLLFYFEKKQDREPIGVIILDNCRIELCPAETSLFSFQIVFEGVGTRTYVLAAESEESMKAWMTKLTHAGHICIKTVVKDLERRLEELKLKEASMAPDVLSESSSESENEVTCEEQTTPTPLPKPPSKALQRAKCKTLPPRRPKNKHLNQNIESPTPNRWSLSTRYPAHTSATFGERQSLGFDNMANFSERTDFLCEDSYHPSRHFSMTAFTPPSFSELKNHEEIEDQNLIDLSPPDGELPLEKKVDSKLLADRFKGNRRAKSERHRVKQGMRRDAGGSLYSLKKRPLDDLDLLEENHESTFQHLHRLWGATIWVKVREYELQHSKPESADSRL